MFLSTINLLFFISILSFHLSAHDFKRPRVRTIEEQQLADFHNDMLIEGVKESSMPMVKKAIGKNADLNTTDEFGFSPLSIAIRQKNIPLAQVDPPQPPPQDKAATAD